MRIRQAIENLIDNAVRHTPAGGSIDVGAERRDGVLRIWVEDTGDGFPPNFVDHAFEPFTRGPGENGDRTGAGLGLTIVRAVAEAHGGSVVGENRVEGGAKVTLVIPT